MDNETSQQFNFVVGQLVDCMNTNPLKGNKIAPPLVLEKTYPVKQVFACQCGQEHLDLGLTSEINFVSCHKCGEHLPGENDGTVEGPIIHWCHPTRFKLWEAGHNG